MDGGISKINGNTIAKENAEVDYRKVDLAEAIERGMQRRQEQKLKRGNGSAGNGLREAGNHHRAEQERQITAEVQRKKHGSLNWREN